jgi:putative endopeptidase
MRRSASLGRVRWISLIAFCLSCSHPTPAPQPMLSSGGTGAWQLDRSTFDSTADACTDFYQHVCGGFATVERIAADRGEALWSTDRANAANNLAIQQLLADKDTSSDPEVGRLRTLFSSCMASAADRTGEATLRTWLARIDGIATRDDVMAVTRELHRIGVAALISYAGEPDPANRARHRAEIDHGALGSLRMYSDTGSTAEERRTAYRAHIQAMFERAGSAAALAQREADVVLEIERRLAGAVVTRAEIENDLMATEHVMTPAAVMASSPHFAWQPYFEMVGQRPTEPLNVTSPRYLQTVDAIVSDRPIADLRALLRWQFLRALGTALPPRLADERYRYLTMAGVQRRPRAEECQLETIRALGVELSRQFSRSIGLSVRDRARAVADRVQAQIARTIPSLDWLSDAARSTTANKASAILLKVGFPDRWPATGSFVLAADTFLDNVLAARAYEQQRSWTRSRTPRSRDTWENIVYPNAAAGMAAARLMIPNGFPDLLSNSILFTAAFLRAPLVDASAPPEVIYGSFGSVAAHEVIHVVELHQFNSLGEQRETWSPADVQAHDARRACVIEQANEFVPFADARLDGTRTYRENVADLSGVVHAYGAMAQELGARLGERGPDGYTPAQRFFIAYAQYYCRAERPTFARENLRDDPHAPSRYRVNGPLSNLPAFAEAFSCRADAAMVRPAASRCAVW